MLSRTQRRSLKHSESSGSLQSIADILGRESVATRHTLALGSSLMGFTDRAGPDRAQECGRLSSREERAKGETRYLERQADRLLQGQVWSNHPGLPADIPGKTAVRVLTSPAYQKLKKVPPVKDEEEAKALMTKLLPQYVLPSYEPISKLIAAPFSSEWNDRRPTRLRHREHRKPS